MRDVVDDLLEGWDEQRPELDCQALSIVVRVQLLARLLGRDAELALEPLGLKLWQYDVLSALRRHGEPYQLPVSELARVSLLSSGAMTTRIDRLEERGLVLREADVTDRRGVNVRLSEMGLKLIDDAIEARLRAADQQLSMLLPPERASLSSGLRKLLLDQTQAH